MSCALIDLMGGFAEAILVFKVFSWKNFGHLTTTKIFRFKMVKLTINYFKRHECILFKIVHSWQVIHTETPPFWLVFVTLEWKHLETVGWFLLVGVKRIWTENGFISFFFDTKQENIWHLVYYKWFEFSLLVGWNLQLLFLSLLGEYHFYITFC